MIVDGRGRPCDLEGVPQRIVSLVPSTTETLHDLGAAERVVGITKYCVHPRPWVDGVEKVGGTKKVDVQRIAALQPDLILANCEENTREIFDALDPVAPLYAAFPRTVDEAIADVTRTGALVGCPEAAARWRADIESAREEARAAARTFRYAYLIWRKPWMAVSADTFIAALLAEVGGVGVFAEHDDRFPAVTAAELSGADPDVVMLSSEPFPFQDKHRAELAAATGLPIERFVLVDGELLSWHGTRMAAGLRYAASQVPRAG